MTSHTIMRIKIDAPSALSAFMLEDRLRHLRPSAVARHGVWCVELQDADDRLDEVVATVRHWLHEIGGDSTLVRVDDVPHTVSTIGIVEEPLGAGYDGRALEHEP